MGSKTGNAPQVIGLYEIPVAAGDINAVAIVGKIFSQEGVTHTMVEIAGKLSEAQESNRLKVLRKATCNPNNGQDVYFVGYDYRCPRYCVPEIMYFKTGHFTVAEDTEGLPVRTVGLFNVDEQEKTLSFTPAQLGLEAGTYILTDVWSGEQYTVTDSFETVLEPHGSRLLAVSKAEGLQLYDANVRIRNVSVAGNEMTLTTDYAYENAELFFHTAPKSITCGETAIPFCTENNITKLSIPSNAALKITF